MTDHYKIVSLNSTIIMGRTHVIDSLKKKQKRKKEKLAEFFSQVGIKNTCCWDSFEIDGEMDSLFGNPLQISVRVLKGNKQEEKELSLLLSGI